MGSRVRGLDVADLTVNALLCRRDAAIAINTLFWSNSFFIKRATLLSPRFSTLSSTSHILRGPPFWPSVSVKAVLSICVFLMEKHDARALTAPNIYGSQNFVAAAVLPTAFSTGVN
jgi:hypothetical protein